MEVLERAQELESLGKNIIHLEIGEPDFPTAPHICAAASSAIWSGETRYTQSLGLPELREAIANHYNAKFRLELKPGQIVVTSGTSPALLLSFMCLLEQDDEVIMSNLITPAILILYNIRAVKLYLFIRMKYAGSAWNLKL